MKRKSAHSLGVRGRSSRRRFCFLLSPRTKGSGRAVDNFLGRIAFFMRGHIATKVWPAGHLLSSHEERRQRRAKGEPLGTPDALIFRAIVGLHNGGWPAPKLAGVESPSGAGPEFSLGKPAGGQTPKPAYIQKRAAARGLGGYKIIDLYYSHPPCDS